MVSMRGSLLDYWCEGISGHHKKRRALGDDPANSSRANSVTLQRSKSSFRGLRRDGDKQTARSLRVEKQILIFGRDARRKSRAVAHKRAIVLEPAGEMTFARRFDGAGEIVEGRVIDFEGYSRNAAGRITQRHLTRVTQQAETGDSVNAGRAVGLLIDFLQRRRSIPV